MCLHPSHFHGFLVETPLWIGAGDKASIRIPSGNPGIAIIEEEEKEFLRLPTLGPGNGVPAAPFLHLRFQKVTVNDTTVDRRLRLFLVTRGTIPADEMPTTSGYVFVDSRNRRTPVFLDTKRSVDTLPSLEPILRTEKGPKTEIKVWCHDENR